MTGRIGMVRRMATALLLVCAACGSAGHQAEPRPMASGASSTPMVSSQSPPISIPPSPADPSPEQEIRFVGTSHPIDPETRGRMAFSWRPECPVALDDLRLLTMSYWGFDHRAHTGEMVVNAKVADDVLSVFEPLFDQRFAIRRMRLVDEYEGNDDRSMAADNTSAFNCRSATGHPGVWSEHSYGWAIDINPRENPYVAGSLVAPPEGAAFLDRTANARGMIHAGDAVVRAFANVGWTWGGSWDSIKDYQHFSRTGQ